MGMSIYFNALFREILNSALNVVACAGQFDESVTVFVGFDSRLQYVYNEIEFFYQHVDYGVTSLRWGKMQMYDFFGHDGFLSVTEP